MLNFIILRITNNAKTVSLLTIKLEKTYIIFINRIRNELIYTNATKRILTNCNNDDNDNINLLHCT